MSFIVALWAIPASKEKHKFIINLVLSALKKLKINLAQIVINYKKSSMSFETFSN